MKRFISSFLILLLLLAHVLPTQFVHAEDVNSKNDGEADGNIFADPNLLQLVEKELDGREITNETLLTIEKLDGEDQGIENLQGIEYLKNLKVLKLRNNKISDLSPIENLTNLKELNVHTNNISSLEPLSKLVKIEKLILRHNHITDIGPLENLSLLSDINLRDNNIIDITPLSKLENVRERLHLDGNLIEDYSPVAHYYYNINDVDFDYPGESMEPDLPVDEEIHFPDDNFFQVIQTELIARGYTEVTSQTLAEITTLKGYRGLEIESIEGIEQLINLEEIELRNNAISDLQPLENLEKLKVIDFRENNISSLLGIEKSTNLVELDVRSNHVESLDPVKNLEHLELIDFRDNRVTDIDALQNLMALKEISARNNGIKDLTPLTNLVNLVELNIHSNEVLDLTPISNLTKLEVLIVRRNNIVDISPLQYLTELVDVNLRDNDISDLSPLAYHKKLTERLHLAGNARLLDFSPIAHYYDDIIDVDFVLPGRTEIDLGQFDPVTGDERSNDLKSKLIDQNRHILDVDVKESKFTELASSPFAFFRGTAPLIFADIKDKVIEIPKEWLGVKGIDTWITGDLHVENIGFYGNRNGEAIFDLNDFDEVAIAPFYYDLLNFGTSLYLLNDAAPFLQLEEDEIKNMVQKLGDYYFEAIERVATGEVNVDDHYYTVDNLDGIVKDIAAEVSELPLNSELITWTTMVDQTRVFDLTNSRLAEATVAERAEIEDNWDSYVHNLDPTIKAEFGKSYFEIKDIVKRTGAGLGSLGYDRYYVLIEGKTNSDADDIILDIKAQGKSAVEASGVFDGSAYETNADRTITGAFALHNYPDIHWGTLKTEKQSYLVKERSPYKEEVKPVDFEGAEDLDGFIQMSAYVLAYAHSRAADSFAENVFNADFDNFSEILGDLTLHYYGQVVEDHRLFVALYHDGAFMDEPDDQNETEESNDSGDNGTGSEDEGNGDPADKNTADHEEDESYKDLDHEDQDDIGKKDPSTQGSDALGNKGNEETGDDVHKLPSTATNMYHFLLFGALLLIIGVTISLYQRRAKIMK